MTFAVATIKILVTIRDNKISFIDATIFRFTEVYV